MCPYQPSGTSQVLSASRPSEPHDRKVLPAGEGFPVCSVLYGSCHLLETGKGTGEVLYRGCPTINRLNYKEKQSGGMFVNTLPFVNELDTASTWNEFNDKLKDDWFHLLYHQRLPFEDIKKLANTGNEVASDQLFEIALSYQNGKMEHLRGARVTLEGRWMYCGYQSETLCIHLSSRDASNQFVVDYDYLTQIFSASEIDALHGRLVKILKEALKNPDLPVGELPILEEEEEERVIFDFNKTNAW